MRNLKIRKIGNSLGVILPKEVLARLGVSEGDELQLDISGAGELRLRRTDEQFAEEVRAVEEIMERYRNALAELAK